MQVKEIKLAYNKYFLFRFIFEILKYEALLSIEDDIILSRDSYEYTLWTKEILLNTFHLHKFYNVHLYDKQQSDLSKPQHSSGNDTLFSFWTYSHFVPYGVLWPKLYWNDLILNTVYCHSSLAWGYYAAFNLNKMFISPTMSRSKNIGHGRHGGVHVELQD